jgi:hypothetical protein
MELEPIPKNGIGFHKFGIDSTNSELIPQKIPTLGIPEFCVKRILRNFSL